MLMKVSALKVVVIIQQQIFGKHVHIRKIKIETNKTQPIPFQPLTA